MLCERCRKVIANRKMPMRLPDSQIELALNLAAEILNVKIAVLRTRDRSQRAVLRRHQAMFLLHGAGFSYPQVAHALHRSQHTTALHGVVVMGAYYKAGLGGFVELKKRFDAAWAVVRAKEQRECA